MQVVVYGNNNNIEEFKSKFDQRKNSFTYVQDGLDADLLQNTDVVFDYYLEESPENLELYLDQSNLTVFCNSPKTSLAELSYYVSGMQCHLFGFNGLPGMVNRDFLELTALDDNDEQKLSEICSNLSTEFKLVKDRVGMITPRVVCMIINEAYYTVQEGTAARRDIDAGMKLGTNYPKGPFEWCDVLGIDNVYEILEALYEDTKDDRYKICPLLKREYLTKK